MIDFFLKYLSQDSIGRMSNAHLIMSDRLGLFQFVISFTDEQTVIISKIVYFIAQQML